MSLLQKAKRPLIDWAISLSRGFGFDIHKSHNLDIEVWHLQSIKNPIKKLSAAQELVLKHPGHPTPHLELAKCLHGMCDPREFEQFDRYAEVRRDWLKKTGFDALDVEFIGREIVTGSLGV